MKCCLVGRGVCRRRYRGGVGTTEGLGCGKRREGETHLKIHDRVFGWRLCGLCGKDFPEDDPPLEQESERGVDGGYDVCWFPCLSAQCVHDGMELATSTVIDHVNVKPGCAREERWDQPGCKAEGMAMRQLTSCRLPSGSFLWE